MRPGVAEARLKAFPFQTAPAVAAALADWLAWLRDERRASPHTLEAYAGDLQDFRNFMQRHLGKLVELAYFG